MTAEACASGLATNTAGEPVGSAGTVGPQAETAASSSTVEAKDGKPSSEIVEAARDAGKATANPTLEESEAPENSDEAIKAAETGHVSSDPAIVPLSSTGAAGDVMRDLQ
jgi:hypothetical protein